MSFEGFNYQERELKPINKNETEIKIDLSDSSNDNVNELNENFDTESQEISYECKVGCEKLKTSLNLPNINGITFRSAENIRNGEITSIKWGTKFEDFIHRGQNFKVLNDDGTEKNIVWAQNSNGEYTYVEEGTTNEAKAEKGQKILPYKENVGKPNEKTDSILKNIISAPTYRNKKGVTLCSRTARENLAKLGIKNIKQGGSARKSFNLYGKSPESFPPKNEQAKVFDLFCDASPKNRKHGHRAVGIKKYGEWYVLDPYYNKTRNPVPANQYLSQMRGRGRKIWGGFSLA